MALAMALSLANSQSIAPANFTGATASLQNDDRLTLYLSDGNNLMPDAPLLGLTDAARNSIPVRFSPAPT